MKKFTVYVEKVTRALGSKTVEAQDADEAIRVALRDADAHEDLDWSYHEEPADIVRWEYADSVASHGAD